MALLPVAGRKGKNKKKQGLQAEGGMSLGLVPPKYLKRRLDASPARRDSARRESLSSLSTHSTAPMTPPRIKQITNVPMTPPTKKFQPDGMGDSSLLKSPLLDSVASDDVVRTDRELETLRSTFSQALLKRERRFRHYESLPFVQEWKDTCLRTDKYDCNVAVTRFLHQWRFKSELFGTPDLKVTIGDILPNIVRAGNIQLVPTRDLAGRAIVTMNFDPDLYTSQEREVKKLLFYVLSSALEDEETQDRGLSFLVWNSHVSSVPWGGLFDSFWSLWKSIRPAFRIERLHYCTCGDGESSSSADSPFTTKESTEGPTLVRHHQGSLQECLHACLTYGVPVSALPIQARTGRVSFQVDFHSKWVEWRQRTDSYHHQHHFKIILVPNHRDVLFGKHAPVGNGNIRFHQIVLLHLEKYLQLDESGRTELHAEIYEDICLENRRFLQPVEPMYGILWEPMDQRAAESRIRDALRFLGSQLEASKALDDSQAKGKETDMKNLQEIFFVKQCCNLINCREGQQPFCSGSSSKLSTYWQNH